MSVSTEGQIIKSYDQALSHLRSLVLEMGGLVEDQITRAIKALNDEDIVAAREVIARDRAINDIDVKVDEKTFNLIAMRQPMASDLRLIMTMEKTVTDLERIGDEVKKIARMIVHIYDSEASPPSNRLFRDVFSMAKIASEMLRNSLDALARQDVDSAVAMITNGDEELNKEFQAGLRRLITYMMEDPRTIGHAINVLFIIKALERIGDHSKNITEYVVYLVKGKDVRHAKGADVADDVDGS